MSSGNFLLGLIVGAAAGAIAGVLFAPDKGSETRKKIIDGGGEYVDALKTKVGGALGAISEKYESGKEAVQDFTGKAKSKFEDAKKGNVNGAY